jgi:hypothetical protein
MVGPALWIVALAPPLWPHSAVRFANKETGFKVWIGICRTGTEGQMARRNTFFVLTHVAILLASTAMTVGASHAEPAAAGCLNRPNTTAPQGSHWFYRVDRETHRQCWFLGPEQMMKRQTMARVKLPVPKPVPRATAEIPVEAVAGEDEITIPFSTRWPLLQKPAGAIDREPTLISYYVREHVTADLQNDIGPMLANAAVLPAPVQKFDHVLAAFTAGLAFAGILGLTIFKYSGRPSRGTARDQTRP